MNSSTKNSPPAVARPIPRWETSAVTVSAVRPAGGTSLVSGLQPGPPTGEPARFGFDLDFTALIPVNLGEVFLNAGVELGGRLPRVLHDSRSACPGRSGQDPQGSPRLHRHDRKQRRGRQVPNQPEHLRQPRSRTFQAGLHHLPACGLGGRISPRRRIRRGGSGAAKQLPSSPAPQEAKSPLPKGAKPEHCDQVPFRAPRPRSNPARPRPTHPQGRL